MYSYTERIVVTPFYIERFLSNSPVIKGFQNPESSSFKARKICIDTSARFASAVARARRRLRLLVACNVTVSHDLAFWSFTFNDDHILIAKNEFQAREYFRQFMKRFQRNRTDSLKYVAIAEKQKKNGRNAWHFHVLFFNLPYYPHREMEKLWRGGFVFVTSRSTEIKSIQHLISYMSKYLSKDTDVGKSKKLYWCSRGLQKPQVLYDKSFDFSEWVLYSELEVEVLNRPQYKLQTYYNSYAIRDSTKTVTHRKISI